MTYTPNTPQATQTIAFTQPLIQDNFTYVNTAMRVNHTWNGNQISTEANGSHQRLDFPNQLADISSLPTGVAAVVYSIGGNLYSYNGAKRPVSGVSVSATVNITTAPATLATLPNDCHGFVTVWAGNPFVNLAASYAFFMVAGVGYFQQAVQPVGSQTTLSIGISANTLAISRSTGADIPNAPYKVIYWPV